MLSDIFLFHTATIKVGWGLWVNVFAGRLIIIPTFIKLGWFMAGLYGERYITKMAI